MDADELAGAIMDQIERDGAIHRSSLVQVIEDHARRPIKVGVDWGVDQSRSIHWTYDYDRKKGWFGARPPELSGDDPDGFDFNASDKMEPYAYNVRHVSRIDLEGSWLHRARVQREEDRCREMHPDANVMILDCKEFSVVAVNNVCGEKMWRHKANSKD